MTVPGGLNQSWIVARSPILVEPGLPVARTSSLVGDGDDQELRVRLQEDDSIGKARHLGLTKAKAARRSKGWMDLGRLTNGLDGSPDFQDEDLTEPLPTIVVPAGSRTNLLFDAAGESIRLQRPNSSSSRPQTSSQA